MTESGYRPWGQLEWVLERCSIRDWDLLGCLSPEDRCLAARKVLGVSVSLGSTSMVLVEDEESAYKEDIEGKLSLRSQQFVALGGSEDQIHRHRLFAGTHEIVSLLDRFREESSGNIILDISTLPKRFFLPAIKRFLASQAVKNLMVTYAVPERYRTDDLAEDYEDWQTLPLYKGSSWDTKHEVLFVGVGHMTMGLPEQIRAAAGEVEVCVFVPFPGDPHSFKRNWEFLSVIDKNLRAKQAMDIKMVNARDVPEIFDHILLKTEYGRKVAVFAPYGPKPISLTMGLFACQTDSAIYYTQPRVYPSDYSTGIAMDGDGPQVYAYLVRLDGRDFYSVPQDDA